MGSLRVLRHGKGTFCEWRFDNGRSTGRVLNHGKGVFIEQTFSSLEAARAFCEHALEQDASQIFYILDDDAIVDAVQDDAWHVAKERKLSRTLAGASLALVLLLASGVSLLFMPFQALVHDAAFIVGMGVLYLLVYSTGGRWNLEGVMLMIVVLVMLAALVSQFAG